MAMGEMTEIEIDLAVHKKIEMGRRNFSEPANAVLRRLLGIDSEPSSDPGPIGDGRRSWFGKGIELPHGTEVRMEYNGRIHSGRIEDGEWVVEGKRFRSASAAAGGVALTAQGRNPSLDGWVYWRAKLPGINTWILISELREAKRAGELQKDTRWVDDIQAVLLELGGEAHLSSIYDHVRLARRQAGRSWPPNAEACIRERLETHSSSSENYKGGPDLFEMVEKGSGVWRLRD
jgi:hypothetical protein